MNLKKLIKETLEKVVNGIPAEAITIEYLKQRIPFLKEYKMTYDRPAGNSMVKLIAFKKDSYNENVERMSKETKIVFQNLNIFSDFDYSVQPRNGEIYHIFGIRNEVLSILDKNKTETNGEVNPITNGIIYSMINALDNQLKREFSADYQIKEENGMLSISELNKIIEDINAKIYQFAAKVQNGFKMDFLEV